MRTEVTRRNILQLALAPALLSRVQVGDMPPTVSRVYPGPDGRLVYVPDDRGNIIHDASHAGYRGGGVAIPTVPVRETIWPVRGDNTAHVQAAIDRVSAMPVDPTGFRGAVLLRAGVYPMATPVTIQASGVVLRGEGMGDTGTILVGTGTGRPAVPAANPGGAGGFGGGGPATLIRIAGRSGVTPQDDTDDGLFHGADANAAQVCVTWDSNQLDLDGENPYPALHFPPLEAVFAYPPLTALLSVPLALLPFDVAGAILEQKIKSGMVEQGLKANRHTDTRPQASDPRLQRPHHYALVDEADNIFIDEALFLSPSVSHSQSVAAVPCNTSMPWLLIRTSNL